MKAKERKSLWHHVVFSAIICAAMAALILVRKDASSLMVAGFLIVYIGGNTFLHYRRQDFHKETFFEYLLISVAVLVVLIGALGL